MKNIDNDGHGYHNYCDNNINPRANHQKNDPCDKHYFSQSVKTISAQRGKIPSRMTYTRPQEMEKQKKCECWNFELVKKNELKKLHTENIGSHRITSIPIIYHTKASLAKALRSLEGKEEIAWCTGSAEIAYK